MRAALSPVDQQGGSPTSFLSLTSWARPTIKFGSTRQVAFSTKSGLDAALAAIQPGDYIYYNGTGVLSITTGPYAGFSGVNVASPGASIDFGTAASIWNPGVVTGNYVEFNYTGTSNQHAFYMTNCSNLYLYGGSLTSPKGGTAGQIYGLTQNVQWLDYYVHDAGGGGIQFAGILGSGAQSTIQNITFRGEVYHWSLNPLIDSHADKGTGFHGNIVHGGTGTIKNSTFAIYAHNPLAPGENSAYGVAQPEGGGGSAIEFGQSPSGSGNNNDNLVAYVRAENMLMQPKGTNPGSGGHVGTAGNAVNLWGDVPLNNLDIVWVEGTNNTGALVHGTPGGNTWYSVSTPMNVDHGRHTNINQYTSGGNISVPYATGFGINYSADCL